MAPIKNNKLTQLSTIIRSLMRAHQASLRMGDISLAKKFNDMKNTANVMYNNEFSKEYKLHEDDIK